MEPTNNLERQVDPNNRPSKAVEHGDGSGGKIIDEQHQTKQQPANGTAAVASSVLSQSSDVAGSHNSDFKPTTFRESRRQNQHGQDSALDDLESQAARHTWNE